MAKCIFPTYEKRRTGFEADSPVDLSKLGWNYLAMVQCMKYLYPSGLEKKPCTESSIM